MEEEVFEIVLADGTSVAVTQNGNCYIAITKVSKNQLTDMNLISLTINGQKATNYHCDAYWQDNGKTWFVIRPKTDNEIKLEEMDCKINYLLALEGVTTLSAEKIAYCEAMGFYTEDMIKKIGE